MKKLSVQEKEALLAAIRLYETECRKYWLHPTNCFEFAFTAGIEYMQQHVSTLEERIRQLEYELEKCDDNLNNYTVWH